MRIRTVKKIAWLLLRGVKPISKGEDEVGCYYEFDSTDKDEIDNHLREFRQHKELNDYLDLYAGVVMDFKELKYK